MTDKIPVTHFEDIRGCRVEVGDLVAFAVRTYDIPELKVGTVLEIYEVEPTYRHRWNLRIKVQAEGGKKPSILEHPKRIVKLEV